MIQVGDREDSSVYVRMKDKAAKEVGLKATVDKLPETMTQAELLEHIQMLNSNDAVHGILVQMPLPSSMDESAVVEAIDPRKDVDGFHSTNTGYLAKRSGQPLFVPCTPKGVLEILKHTDEDAYTLQQVKQADILVVAVGKPELVKGEWIKPGAVVIDVGINYVPDATKKSGMRLVGDVEYTKAAEVASAITPVPGGVGPLTVAMLMDNTLISAKRWYS
ncbi:tetrahydrofolate synthase [Apophysomyces ossiformis]|uniref:Tetrahydrofolate synthase n=1 Tax=Apophysomyces ossiformis TaxID=679940 RepID=A0A8H7BV76_9FUNG|nr:tetrahydrofolate synthase [Apophysomyces ossiformis]